MIFGAVILGGAIGLVAMTAAIITGTGVLGALLTYWIAGSTATVGIVLTKTFFCKDSQFRAKSGEPASNQPEFP